MASFTPEVISCSLARSVGMPFCNNVGVPEMRGLKLVLLRNNLEELT